MVLDSSYGIHQAASHKIEVNPAVGDKAMSFFVGSIHPSIQPSIHPSIYLHQSHSFSPVKSDHMNHIPSYRSSTGLAQGLALTFASPLGLRNLQVMLLNKYGFI
jgi:hypothetical protein